MTTVESPHQPNVVLMNFCRIRGVEIKQLAEALQCHRNTARAKRAGAMPLTDLEVQVLARAFDIPAEVFDMPPIEAMQWAIDNRPTWFGPTGTQGATSLASARQQKLQAKLREPAGVLQWNRMGLQAA